MKTLGASAMVGMAGCASLNESVNPEGSSNTGSPNETGSPGGDRTPTPISDGEGGGNQTETSGQNGSAETTLIDDFEDLSQWKTVAGRVSSANDAYAGDSSAKIHRKEREPVITRDVDIDFTKYNPSFAIKTDTDRISVVEMTLDAPDENNQLILREGVRPWPSSQWMRLDLGVRGVNGLPDLQNVTKIRLRLKGGGNGSNFWVDDLRAVPSPEKGTVALTFDDSLASQYEHGFNIMSKFDMPGTMFTVTDRVGDNGYITLDQMKEMQSGGWEFGSHGQTSEQLIEISRLTAEEEIVGAKEWLVDNGFETGAEYIAYPFGKFDAGTLNFLKDHHRMGFRYLGTESAGCGRITEPLTASRGNGANLERAKQMVQLGALYNDLQIYTFHDIGSEGNLSMSPREFEELVAFIADQEVDVVTVSQIDEQFRTDIN